MKITIEDLLEKRALLKDPLLQAKTLAEEGEPLQGLLGAMQASGMIVDLTVGIAICERLDKLLGLLECLGAFATKDLTE